MAGFGGSIASMLLTVAEGGDVLLRSMAAILIEATKQ